MRSIEMRLNTQSINAAINYLKNYQRELENKNKIFVQRLTDDGYVVARYYLGGTLGDSTNASVSFQFQPGKDTCIARISLTGQDALFVEFGAGISYNPNNLGASNPLGNGQYGVGTYPNQTHAYDKGWWYTGADGQSHYSSGTEATMPLYHAQMEIMQNVTRIAREVFGT